MYWPSEASELRTCCTELYTSKLHIIGSGPQHAPCTLLQFPVPQMFQVAVELQGLQERTLL